MSHTLAACSPLVCCENRLSFIQYKRAKMTGYHTHDYIIWERREDFKDVVKVIKVPNLCDLPIFLLV